MHVAIGSSISNGNFPPEVPYFAGQPLAYHWFADFHGAITATAAGIDLIPVYFVTSSIFAGVLALVVWALAVQLTGDRRVALIATILVSAGGGLGWIRLVGDLVAGAGNVAGPDQQQPRTTTPGPMAGRTSRSPRSSGPGPCPTERRPSGCPGSSASSSWS